MRLIISPSGNLYGSENVLFDYLKSTSLNFDRLYVPRGSHFENKLKESSFNLFCFSTVKRLYLGIFLLLFLKRIESVYCNEAGHVRYIVLLARFFPRVIFIIHVRIIEDCDRFEKITENMRVIAISNTIGNKLSVPYQLIYDGYDFENLAKWTFAKQYKVLKVGIVGRVTKTKGISLLTPNFFQNAGSNIEFHFFGDVDSSYESTAEFLQLKMLKNTFFHGFESDKSSIYDSVDLLLHLNKNEPLGRIFFESLDYGIPFIGIHNGGIAEIADLIEYPYTFEKSDIPLILNRILISEVEIDLSRLDNARNKAIDVFSINNYSFLVDKLQS